jgi:hypothetical protein
MKIDTFIQTIREHFNLAALEHEALENLKKTFISLDYREETVYKALGVPHLGIASLNYLPILLDFKLASPTPLNTLMKLFLFSQAVAERELLKELFTKNDLDACVRMKILERQGSMIRAAIDFYPCLGYYMATDHRYPDYKFPNAVMYLGQDSYTLARGTIRKPAGSVLDLCTGSGVHAILASGHSQEVTGVDINARAVNFSRFNSIFNRVGNVTFIKGDLLEPVHLKKFDMILANPPFVPAPEVKILYRDGGVTGEEPLKKILAGLDDTLTDGGICQVFTLLVFQQGQDYLEKLRDYLGARGYHILVLATSFIDAGFFVMDQMSDFGTFDEYRRKLAEWLKCYYEHGIYQLADGIITIARAPRGISPVHRLVKFRNLGRSYSKEVESYFHMLCTCQDEEALAARIPLLRGAVKGIWKECLLKASGAYTVLFADDDLSFQAELDEDEFAVLGLCDGCRTVAEIAALHAGVGAGRDALRKKCHDAVRQLAEKWVIELSENPS